MKILRIRIGSFGSLSDRDYTLDPGLNVFFGPNEAGKSSLRSFITSTLFQKTGIRYPETKKSDCGKLEICMSDGTQRMIERDGKKSLGCVDAECGISGKEYTSIYSMDPDDLRDVSDLEKGDIRNRFLTIPGGKDLPKIFRELKEERTSYVPDGRRSEKSRMSVLAKDLQSAKEEVVRLQMRENGDGAYNTLAEKEKTLGAQLEEARKKASECDTARKKADIGKEREKTVSAIRELEAEESTLAYSERFGDDCIPSEIRLRKSLDDAEKESAEAERLCRDAENAMGGYDADTVLRNSGRIGKLGARRDRGYEGGKTLLPTEEKKARGGNTVLILAAVMIAAGIGVALVNAPAGIAVAAAGAVLAAVSFMRSKKAVPAAEPRPSDSGSDADLERAASEIGIPRTDPETDADTLRALLDKAEIFRDRRWDLEKASHRKEDAENALSLFYAGFGGKDGFEKAMADRRELGDVRSRISALRGLADTSPAEEYTDPETADGEYSAASEEVNRLSEEYGKVKEALRNIERDASVEDAITKRSEAENAVYSAALEWASLMMQQIILDEASENMYSGSSPGVIGNADRFLSLMTDGRYGMASDPASESLAVKDLRTGEVKTSGQWSSGLGDQVKLSLKMAVSLSLSDERPPVILDDVLLTSDSGRKEGACKAAAELSRDIQVIYFTCDRETRDLMEKAGGRIIGV